MPVSETSPIGFRRYDLGDPGSPVPMRDRRRAV
jgi:hypothetical protein